MTSGPSHKPRKGKGRPERRQTTTIWHCDLYGLGGWIHGCPACWIRRLLFVVMVLAPLSWLVKEWLIAQP